MLDRINKKKSVNFVTVKGTHSIFYTLLNVVTNKNILNIRQKQALQSVMLKHNFASSHGPLISNLYS